MAYFPIGRITRYYERDNEAEVEIDGEGLAPGDYVKIGSLDSDEFKVSAVYRGGRSVSMLRPGDVGVIDVNGEVMPNQTVYKHD